MHPRPVCLALALLLFLPAAARAAEVNDIRLLQSRPLAPRGGVMMVPLTAARPGDQWPAALDVEFADGREGRGRVVWVHQMLPDPLFRRSWTADASFLAVRAIESDDDTSSSRGGAPYLLVRMPEAGEGSIRVEDQTVRPIWRDPDVPYAGVPLPGDDRPILPRTTAAYRPDAQSPFEYWRWVLLADRLNVRPPPVDDYEGVEALVARHYADVWRIALARIGRHSPGVASTCRDLLTRVCADRSLSGGEFAAWVSDPDELSLLLATLLNFRQPDDVVLRDALAWADSRRALFGWVEAEFGDMVRVAFINRSFDPVVARFHWEGAEDLPVAVEVQPEVLTHIDIDRPPLPPGGPLELEEPVEPQRQVLRCVAPEQVMRFGFGRRIVAARPPGAAFPPFVAPLSLAEVETGRQLAVPEEHATGAHIRRLHDRWEVFFECRRPARDAAIPLSQGSETLEGFESWGSVRNVESVTLLIGPEKAPRVALTVPEIGWHRLFAGVNDGTLQVHRKSYSDRWYCRLVLPDVWLSDRDEGGVVLFGAFRTHEGGDALEMTPTRAVPWRLTPGRMAVDIEAWTDLPE